MDSNTVHTDEPKLISIRTIAPDSVKEPIIIEVEKPSSIAAKKSSSKKLPSDDKFCTEAFKNELLDTLCICLVYTSFNGIPFLTRTKYRFMRIFWFILFLGSLGFMGYNLYLAITNYYTYPSITTANEYTESPMQFPAITICNINPFATEYASNLLKQNLSYGFNVATNFTLLKQIKDNLLIQEYNSPNRTLMGFPLTEILITFKYNNKEYMPREFLHYFQSYYSYDHGNCYTFNSGMDENNTTPNSSIIRSMYYPGSKNGFYIEMFARTAKNDTGFDADYGAVLFVHNQTQRPDSVSGIRLKLGTKTNAVLHKTFVHNAPDPYSSCEDLDVYQFNRVLYNVITDTPYAYSQKDCFGLCLQKMITEQCQCYDVEYLPLDNATEPCLSNIQTICANDQHISFINQDENQLCQDYCPLECDSSAVTSITSYAGFPTNLYGKVLLHKDVVISHYANVTNISKIDIKKDILAVNIYFNNFAYTDITNSPQFGVFDLIGNIGGLVGLFIGVSYLSFFEILDLVVTLFSICIKKKFNK